MVAHMKTVHEQYEVYVSRISQPMVDMAISRALPRAIKYIKHKSTQYLKATCLFCEEDKDFMPHYWNDHIRSHTGEWGHECRLCLKNTCFYTHCSHPTSKIVEFNAYVENLYAFLCRKCNYIQLDEKNIHKHLKNEHEMKNPQLDREYQKIMLLPAMKNLQFSRNPHLPGKFNFSTNFSFHCIIFTKRLSVSFDYNRSTKFRHSAILWKDITTTVKTKNSCTSSSTFIAINKWNYGFGRSCHSTSYGYR